jgi:hypothetical protein
VLIAQQYVFQSVEYRKPHTGSVADSSVQIISAAKREKNTSP